MNKKELLENKKFNFYTQNSVSCKCGHRMFIGNKFGKCICNWCGNMVYLDKKDEFKNLLKNAIKNTNNGIDNVPNKV